MAMASIGFLEWMLLLANVLLLIFSRHIFSALDTKAAKDDGDNTQLNVFRMVNVLIIVLVLANNWWLPKVESSWLTKLISSLFLSYLFVLVYKVVRFFVLLRYGKHRNLETTATITETYSSRALSLIAGMIMFIVWLLSIIQVLEFNTLLQASGVIGFVGVMLGLTQGSWAPDIISGLIVLNSDMVEEGDVLELETNGQTLYAAVFKTKMFHTELLDISNNHRIMIKNSRLRELQIGNLSKFASAKGLREQLNFNIGYEVPAKKVREFFDQVEARLQERHQDQYEAQHPIELRVINAGDNAVEWAMFYYLKKTRDLLGTRQLINQVVVEEADKAGIVLATPALYSLTPSLAD
ncbi:MAG: hypothetical protein ACR2PS_02715 [Pseudomonadales bacterium]